MKSLSYSLSCVAVLLSVTACQIKPASNTFGPSATKSKTTAPTPATASASATAPLPATAGMLPPAAGRPGPGSGRISTGSGLQYEVLASGPAEGRSPTRADSVVVHYHGTLPSGTVFDSSVERGQPATFGVGQVIPGWTEALQLMKPGDKWMLYIPFNLAYGGKSMGKIPPYSDLTFQVELLQIISAQ